MQLIEMSEIKKGNTLTLIELGEEITDRFCRRGARKWLRIDRMKRLCVHIYIPDVLDQMFL
jgi:hypothetical protein